MKYEAWASSIALDDPDRDFILNVVKNGFSIIDNNSNIFPADVPNHNSVNCNSHFYKEVNKQVLKEIENGNYVVCKDKPLIISPMGAIPKDDGTARIIHDCSLPSGGAVNDYASDPEKYSFETMDNVAKLISKDCYIA